jgi:hypothetical protein
MIKQNLTFLIVFIFLISCNSGNYDSDHEESSSSSNTDEQIDKDDESSYYYKNNEEVEKEESNNGCKFEDGNYSATVNYNNSETNYSATYNLDVEVQNCMVIQINFPNDGYLDEDHISPAEIDDYGNVLIEGEDGKSYEIQIEN